MAVSGRDPSVRELLRVTEPVLGVLEGTGRVRLVRSAYGKASGTCCAVTNRAYGAACSSCCVALDTRSLHAPHRTAAWHAVGMQSTLRLQAKPCRLRTADSAAAALCRRAAP
jgi:hypothetical protein